LKVSETVFASDWCSADWILGTLKFCYDKSSAPFKGSQVATRKSMLPLSTFSHVSANYSTFQEKIYCRVIKNLHFREKGKSKVPNNLDLAPHHKAHRLHLDCYNNSVKKNEKKGRNQERRE
jgi:hypothetical protein